MVEERILEEQEHAQEVSKSKVKKTTKKKDKK